MFISLIHPRIILTQSQIRFIDQTQNFNYKYCTRANLGRPKTKFLVVFEQPKFKSDHYSSDFYVVKCPNLTRCANFRQRMC